MGMLQIFRCRISEIRDILNFHKNNDFRAKDCNGWYYILFYHNWIELPYTTSL